MYYINDLIKNIKSAMDFGFRWPESIMILKQILSEIQEVRQALNDRDKFNVKDEIGDLFHANCSLAIFYNKCDIITVDLNNFEEILAEFERHISSFKNDVDIKKFILRSFLLIKNLRNTEESNLDEIIKNSDEKFSARFNKVKTLVKHKEDVNDLTIVKKLELWSQAKDFLEISR